MGFADSASKVAGARWLQDQMDVVGHQAVGPHGDVGLQCLLGQQVEGDFVAAGFKKRWPLADCRAG